MSQELEQGIQDKQDPLDLVSPQPRPQPQLLLQISLCHRGASKDAVSPSGMGFHLLLPSLAPAPGPSGRPLASELPPGSQSSSSPPSTAPPSSPAY